MVKFVLTPSVCLSKGYKVEGVGGSRRETPSKTTRYSLDVYQSHDV